MLKINLEPLLHDVKGKKRKQRYNVAKAFFDEHTENMADSIEDMAYVCQLPNAQRRLVTYPVVGNWVLNEMGFFVPKTEHQRRVLPALRNIASETRFNNSHTEDFYGRRDEYNASWDELNGLMLSNPEESIDFHKFLLDITQRASTDMREVMQKPDFDEESYTIDLGHGLLSPFGHFDFITHGFENSVQQSNAAPLNLTVMVVDDEHPDAWYKRMISVGFAEREGQKGYFHDCESALAALEAGQYDVILTDLELGKGKMSGVDFIEKAYQIQKGKGLVPRISAFSYNQQALKAACDRYPHYDVHGVEPRVFQQLNLNNKSGFTAMHFRNDVESAVRRYQ